MAYENDLTNLGPIATDDNRITDVNVTEGTYTNIDFGAQPTTRQRNKFEREISTQLEKDTNLTREQALDNLISGIPQTTAEDPLTISQKRPDVYQAQGSFTTRDQVMSQLNLMDENFDYTDTYTNYINQGGTPIQGYEHVHTALLEQERKEALFQQADEGTISFDNALMEAYGKEIMATMGYDLTSVAYWQNKFYNNDYSNPFNNNYLMSQVKSAALEQYNVDIIKKTTSQQANKFATASGMVGDELTGKQIRDLFGDLDLLAEEQKMTDDELRKACLSGQIAADSRIMWTDDSKTEAFYLHTDGQLYHLTGSDIRKDSQGNVTDITVNGSELADFGRHFVSGVANVFTGLYKLGGVLVVGAGSFLFDHKDITENVVDFLNNTDAAINDFEGTNWLTDTGHVDMDGFNLDDPSDWAMIVADIGGTIVGGMGVAAIGSGLASAGGKLASTGANAFARAAGKGLQVTGNLMARSTGMYAGAKDVNLNTFTFLGGSWTGKTSMMHNHMLKTCTVYAVKDYYSMSQQMANQMWQVKAAQGETMTESDYDQIALRSGLITLGNYAISSVFAGGINDNQTQRLASAFGQDTAEQKAINTILDELGDSKEVRKLVKDFTKNKVLTKSLTEKISDESLKSFLSARRNRIVFNTGMDFIDNFLTMSSSDIFTQVDEDGKLVSFSGSFTQKDSDGETVWFKHLAKNLVQGVIMTGPTLKGNIESADYNVATATLRNSFQKFNGDIDNAIKKASTPEAKQTLTLLKQDVMNTYNNAKGTAEEKIIATFDHAHSMLKNEKGDSIVTKAISEAVSSEKIKFYQGLHKAAYNKALLYEEAYQRYVTKSLGENRKKFMGTVTAIPKALLRNWAGIGEGKWGEYLLTEQNLLERKAASDHLEAQMAKDYATVGDIYDVLTGSSRSSKALDKLEDIEDIYQLEDSVEYIIPISQKQLDKIPVPKNVNRDEFLANHTIIRIKNEAAIEGKGKLNDRLKGSIMKTALDLIVEDTNGTLVTKLDNNYYAIPTSINVLSKTFRQDTITKLTVGLASLAKGNPAGVELLLTTMLGDEQLQELGTRKRNNIAAKSLDAILNTAIKNNVLTEGEVVTLMDNLLVKEDLDPAIAGAINAFRKMVTNVTESKYDSMTDTEKYYYIYKSAKEILADYKENNKAIKSEKRNKLVNMFVDVSDSDNPTLKADVLSMMSVLEATKKLTREEVNTIVEICQEGLAAKVPTLSEALNRILKVASQEGIEYSKDTEEGFINMLIDEELISKVNKKKKELDDTKKEIRKNKNNKELLARKQNIEAEYNAILEEYNKLYDEIKNFYQTVIKLNEDAVDMDMNNNLVVLNGAKIYPENLKEIAKEYRNSKEDEKSFRISTQDEELLKTQSEIFTNQIRVFDLNEARDIEILGNLLKDLKLVSYNEDLSTAESIKRAITIIDNEDIIFSSGKQSVLKKGLDFINTSASAEKFMENIKKLKMKKFIVNPSTGKAIELDVYNAIRATIDLSNLSEEMMNNVKRVRATKLYPFEDFNESALLESPERIIEELIDTTEKLAKAGTGGNTSKYAQIAKQTIAKEITLDKDLAKKLALLQIVDAYESDKLGHLTYILPNTDKVKEAIENTGFFKYEHTGQGTIKVMVDPTKFDDMRKYIVTSKEVNLFNLIPLMTSEHSTNTEIFIEQFPIREYNGKEVYKPNVFDDNAGLHQGLDNLLNIAFSWDLDNSIKNEIFLGLFAKANEGDYNYNILSDQNKVASFKGSYKEHVEKIMKGKIKGVNSPIGKLLDVYNTVLPKVLKGDGSGDYKAWLLNPTVLRFITDVYNSKGLSGVQGIKADQVIQYYLSHKPNYGSTDNMEISSSPVILNRGDIDNPVISGDIILEASGREIVLADDNGNFYADDLKVKQDIQKALSEAVNIIKEYEVPETGTRKRYITMYRDSDDMNFAASVAGHNGYITIEDLDYMIDMEFSFFKKLYEGSGRTTEQLKKDFKTLKDLANKYVDAQNRRFLSTKEISVKKGAESASTKLSSAEDIILSEKDLDTEEGKEAANLAFKLFHNNAPYESDFTRSKRLSDFREQEANKLFDNLLERLDNKITTKFFSAADREVLNINNKIGKLALYRIINNTTNTLENVFKDIDPENNIDRNNLLKSSYELLEAVGGTKGEYEGYAILDVTDGSLKYHFPKAYDNGLEINSELNKLEDLQGKIFISMESHNLQSNDGISMSYKYLETEDDIEDLKTAFLEDGIASAYKVRDKRLHKEDSFKEYVNYLRSIPQEELNLVLKNAERMQMSRKKHNEIITEVVTNLLAEEGVATPTQEYIAKTLLETNRNNPFYSDNSVNNFINREYNDLKSSNPFEREQAALAVYGQTYKSLNDDQKNSLEVIQKYLFDTVENDLAKEYGYQLAKTEKGTKDYDSILTSYWNALREQQVDSGEFTMSNSDKVDLILSYLSSNLDAQTISYITNKKLSLETLNTNPQEYNSISFTDWGDNIKIKPQELQDIFDGKGKQTAQLIDIEGIKAQGLHEPSDISEAFQIAIKKFTKDGEELTTETYFIKHGNKTPDELMKENDIVNTKFYKDNQGYKDAWEEYKKAYDNNSPNLIDESEVYKLFEKDSIIIGFNGENYDFKLLRKHLEDKEINPTYIDVLKIAAAFDDNAVNHKVSQESLYEKYVAAMDTEKAHNAFEDVNMMRELTQALLDNCVTFKQASKSLILEDINYIAKKLNIAEEDLPTLYKELDKYTKGIEISREASVAQENFRQSFVDASATSQILRMLNYLERNDLGKIMRDFDNSEMYKQLKVQDSIQYFIKYGADNLVTAMAHLRSLDPTKTTKAAFDEAISTAIRMLGEEDVTFKRIVETINSKDFLSYMPGEIDYNNIEFQSKKDLIQDNLSKNLFEGIKDMMNGLGLDATDVRNYTETGQIDTALRSLHSSLKTMNLNNDVQDLVIKSLLSPTTSSNGEIEDYNIKRVAKLENKLFKAIQNSTQKYNATETLLINPMDAGYNMIAPFTPDSEFTEYVKTDKGITTKSLKGANASDIILTKEAAEEIFGMNIESIFGKDNEAWVYSLAYPSDKANALMAHRLRIVEGTGTRIFLTPITQKILRARDFDGDFITVWGGLTEQQKTIAKEQLKYVYKSYEIQENLHAFLNKYQKENKPNSKAIDAYEVAQHPKVLKASYELDVLLQKRANAIDSQNRPAINRIEQYIKDQVTKLNNTITKVVNKKDPNSFFTSAEDVIELIGFEDSPDYNRAFIKNPVLVNNKYTEEGTECYSYKSYYNNVLRKAAYKDTLGDSMAGYFKKWKQFQNKPREQITMPLKQLGLTDVTVAPDIQARMIDVATNNALLKNYQKELVSQLRNISKELYNLEFNNNMLELIDGVNNMFRTINETTDITEREYLLTQVTNLALQGTEINIRGNETFNKNMLDALTANPLDKSYEEAVNHRKEIQKIFHSKDNSRYIYGDNGKISNLNSSVFLNKIQDDYINTHKIKYIDSINDVYKTGTCSVAVCIDDLDAEDQVIWNKDSDINFAKVIRERIDYKKEKGKQPKIEQGKVYLGDTLNAVLGLELEPNKKYLMGRVKRTAEGISRVEILSPGEPVENVKIHALSKGVAIATDKFEKDANFDVVVSGAGFKDFNKYLQSLGKVEIEEDIKEFTLPGQTTKKRFKIVHGVPLHKLIDDSTYDKESTKNYEFMAVPGNIETVLGVALNGTFAYDLTDKKELYRDFSKVAPILENDKGTTFNWSTAVPAIQSIRANIIADAIDYYNAWEQMSDIITNKKLRNKKAWLNNVCKNYEICTKEFNTALNSLIHTLGEENFGKFLATRDDITAKFFSEDVMKDFIKYIPSEMYAFTSNGKPIILKSKNKAADELRVYQSETPGEIYNATEKTLGVATRFAEDYYVPMSKLYKLLNAYVDQDAVFDATARGILGFGKHHESSLADNFAPKNEMFKLEDNKNISDHVNNNELKNGTSLQSTTRVHNKVYGISYNHRAGEGVLLKDLIGEPNNHTLETSLYDNLNRDAFVYNYAKTKTALGKMLYDVYNKNNNSNFDKLTRIIGGNISNNIQLDVAKRVKTLQDGKIVSTVKTIQDEVDYNKLVNKELEELNSSLSNYGFYTFKDIKNKLDSKDIVREDAIKAVDNINKYEEDKKVKAKEFQEKLSKALALDKLEDSIIEDKGYNKAISFTFDAAPTNSPFKNSLMSRSGIKITTADEMQIDVAMKNYGASVESYKIDAMNKFNVLKSLANSKDKQAFEKLCVYTWYKLSEKENPMHASAILKYTGASNIMEYKKSAEALTRNNPKLVKALNDFYESVKVLSKRAEATTGEEFGNLAQILAPFTPANKELTKQSIQGNLKRLGVINSETNFNRYDPSTVFQSNMVFNFFESAPVMIDQLAKVAGMQEFSKTLLNNKLIDNTEVTDKAYEFLNDNVDVTKLYHKGFTDEFYTIEDTIYDVIRHLTSLNTTSIRRKYKNPVDALKVVYNSLYSYANDLRAQTVSETGEVPTFSELYRLSVLYPEDALYKKAYNAMQAQIICAQRLSELSPKIINNVQNYIEELNSNGIALCNKFGQKISMDTPFKPITEGSLKYLSDNIELYANNSSPEKFAQYILERAIRGELYTANANMIDQLDKRVYTKDVSNKLKTKFQEISTLSSSIQMALPAKLISRLLRFTGFDYVMGLTYSHKVVPEIVQAGKEISQAIYSKGESITEDSLLYQYLIREGQPIGQTGKDPVTFTENINKSVASITDKLTTPLQYQNHLGRYAIWLAAYKSFEEGKPWYGPVYHKKAEIDALGNTKEANYDKAMYIMDYMLGSPGGFPNVSKSISGYLMYATFPLNLTRTLGAYGMSLKALAQEGITEDNIPHWWRSVVSPSASLLIMNYLSNVMISAICEMYDIDEETEEEWQKEGVSIDPLGTALGGTPSVVYDSLLPNKNLKEMFLKPLTSEYNETLTDKALGLTNSTILSHLNPAIKIPIEIITRKDLYGSYPIETKYKYTASENAMRKVLGFITGSGVANSVIDQYKIDAYNDDDTSFYDSLSKGFINGFSADLGNQKSWKKNTSNYYSVLDSLREYKSANGEKYGTTSYSEDYASSDYARINSMIKKMIHNKVSPTTLYNYIISEYNNTRDISTLRSVLNNNSVLRKLNTIDKKDYLNSLTEKELERVIQAIQYEQDVYPFLETLFVETSSKKQYLPSRKKYYTNEPFSGSGYSSSSPKKYYPSFVYPEKNYGSGYNKYNTKYGNGKFTSNEVNVSPQMGIWKNNYNKVEDLERNEWYLDNPFYNNLSEYEKRQKGGN